jgi:hypothetical protein
MDKQYEYTLSEEEWKRKLGKHYSVLRDEETEEPYKGKQ